MKRMLINPLVSGLLWFLMITAALPVKADEPPPPPAEHGSSEDLPPGGGVPVEGGTGVLLVLSVVYAISRLKKEKSKD